MAERLAAIQIDLTATVAPNADLVFWSRLGSDYAPDDLQAAIAAQQLVEFQGILRPSNDLALFRAAMTGGPGIDTVDPYRRDADAWVEANHACHREILVMLRTDGPLPARELPDTCVRPWRSSGWNDGRNVRMMIQVMEARGEVAVAGRDGRDRLWDLAERLHPPGPTIAIEEATAIRGRRRLAALGIARMRTTESPGEPNSVGDVGEEAVIEGVRGKWRVDPAQLAQPFCGRTALLSPLDRLISDRKRMGEVFAFDYQLEMYKPAANRRWGYFALPILHGDRLVGKLDATADHRHGVLRVDAVHDDVGLNQTASDEVEAEIRALASWLGLELDRHPRS